jgi:hypothetical protein
VGETINDPDGRGKRGPMDSHPRTTRRLIEAGRGGTSPPSRNVPAELWVIVDVGPTTCFCVSACNRPEYILRGSTSSCRSSSPCQCLCSPAHPSWTPKTDLRSIPNDRKTYACQMKANKNVTCGPPLRWFVYLGRLDSCSCCMVMPTSLGSLRPTLLPNRCSDCKPTSAICEPTEFMNSLILGQGLRVTGIGNG